MSRQAVWMNRHAQPGRVPNAEERAMDTAQTIAERPVTIVISRLVNSATIQLAPQVVRIDLNQNVRAANELHERLQQIDITEQFLIVLGYKDHPTIPNTNLQRADLFFYQGAMYEILELLDSIPGRLIASAKKAP